MNIGIVGGGPAGLYFTLLLKQLAPSHQITLDEFSFYHPRRYFSTGTR